MTASFVGLGSFPDIPVIEFRCLGGLDVRDAVDGRQLHSLTSQGKRVALLAYLALARPRSLHARETLLGLFWPELPPERARRALNQALYVLRRGLGQGAIERSGNEAVGLAAGALQCDVLDFEEALAAGDVVGALSLYGGELLAGFHVGGAPAYERWLEEERSRLRGLAVPAALAYADRLEAGGEIHEAVYWTRRACSWAPLDEGPLRVLLGRLERGGDRAGAVREYESYAARLRAELDLDPEPETQRLGATLRAPAVAEPAEMDASGAVEAPARAAGPDVPAVSALQPGGVELPGLAGRRPRQVPAGRVLAPVATATLLLLGPSWMPPAATRGGETWAADGGEPPVPDERRVLVLALENRTGDPGLDPVGAMTADWITNGIAETGLVEIVTSATSLALTDEVDPRGGAEVDAAHLSSLAARTGARLVVWGAYYLDGDSLLLHAQVSNAAGGRLLRAIGPVSAPRGNAVAGVELLRQRVVGSLAGLVDPLMAAWAERASVPPSFEAYREFVEGLQLVTAVGQATPGISRREAALEHFFRAAAYDSSFTQPLLWAMRVQVGPVQGGPRTDSTGQRLLRRRHHMPPLDRAILDANLARLRHDAEAELVAYRRVLALAPGSEFVVTAASAATTARRPAEAVDILVRGAEANAGLRSSEQYLMQLARAYHALGRHDAELEAARELRALPRLIVGYGPYHGLMLEADALAAAGRGSEVLALYDTLVAVIDQSNGPNAAGHWLALELLRHGQPVLAGEVLGRVLAWFEGREPRRPWPVRFQKEWAYALVTAGRWSDARALFEAVLAARPADSESRVGRAYVAAKLGDRATALVDRAWLEALDEGELQYSPDHPQP